MMENARRHYEQLFAEKYHLEALLRQGYRLSRQEAELCSAIESGLAGYETVLHALPAGLPLHEHNAQAVRVAAGITRFLLQQAFGRLPIDNKGFADVAAYIPSLKLLAEHAAAAGAEEIMHSYVDVLAAYLSVRKQGIERIASLTAWYFHHLSESVGNPASVQPVYFHGICVSGKEEGKAFAGVGGQEHAVAVLDEIVQGIANPRLYRQWGTSPPRGVLLHGPPGTGKTLLAQTLAGNAAIPFYHVRLADVVSKWFGEAEQRLQALFDRTAQQPSILFFDEIDALSQRRAFATEGAQRMLAVLLENMDGMGSSETATMIGATNALQSIDAALLRPGRFDFLVEVPLPDEMGREEILRIHAAEAEERAGRELFAHVNYAGIAVAMEGYSGADIAEIIKRALRWKVKEVREGNAAESVGTADVMRQVKMYERESATL